VSDKDEATTGWEGDDELDSEDLPRTEPPQLHTDTEAGQALPTGQEPVQDQRAAGEEQHIPAAEQEKAATETPDTGPALAAVPAAASAAMTSQSAADEDEREQGSPSAASELGKRTSPTDTPTDAVPEAAAQALEAAERASSLDRQPDTPPLSPPRSPLPAASAEPAPPEAGSPEGTEELGLPEHGPAHQRRPSDDVESTASTSHARDPAVLQEADAVSGPVKGMLLLCPRVSKCMASD
jgi:hypothetical protein